MIPAPSPRPHPSAQRVLSTQPPQLSSSVTSPQPQATTLSGHLPPWTLQGLLATTLPAYSASTLVSLPSTHQAAHRGAAGNTSQGMSLPCESLSPGAFGTKSSLQPDTKALHKLPWPRPPPLPSLHPVVPLTLLVPPGERCMPSVPFAQTLPPQVFSQRAPCH